VAVLSVQCCCVWEEFCPAGLRSTCYLSAVRTRIVCVNGSAKPLRILLLGFTVFGNSTIQLIVLHVILEHLRLIFIVLFVTFSRHFQILGLSFLFQRIQQKRGSEMWNYFTVFAADFVNCDVISV
jgi:hypothetical protein